MREREGGREVGGVGRGCGEGESSVERNSVVAVNMRSVGDWEMNKQRVDQQLQRRVSSQKRNLDNCFNLLFFRFRTKMRAQRNILIRNIALSQMDINRRT